MDGIVLACVTCDAGDMRQRSRMHLGAWWRRSRGPSTQKPRGANRIDPVGVFPYAWKNVCASVYIYIYTDNVVYIISLYIIYICSIYCTINMNNHLKLESKRDLNILNLTLSSFQSLFDPRQSSKRRWVVGPGGYGWMDSYGSLKIRLPICFIPASNFGDQSFWAIAVWIHVSIPPWPSDCRNRCPESSDAWRMIVMVVSFLFFGKLHHVMSFLVHWYASRVNIVGTIRVQFKIVPLVVVPKSTKSS